MKDAVMTGEAVTGTEAEIEGVETEEAEIGIEEVGTGDSFKRGKKG
jgi:hypothetical protein